jgi:hypothetical protein
MQYNHTALIDNKNGVIPSEIEIRYKGDTIDDLHMYEATIWNSGSREIRQSDFLDAHGVELEVPQNGRVLSAEILSISNEKIGAIISVLGPEEGKINVKFRVLEPNDGFVIKVLHSKKGRMGVSFPIMGLMNWKIYDKQHAPNVQENIILFVFAILSTIVSSLSIYAIVVDDGEHPLFILIMSIVLLVIGVGLLGLFVMNIRHPTVPSDLVKIGSSRRRGFWSRRQAPEVD